MSDTFNEIKAIIVDLLGVDEDKVTLEASFREDLEADSLDHSSGDEFHAMGFKKLKFS